MTAGSMHPAVLLILSVLLLSSFVKIFTSLSIMKTGLGLSSGTSFVVVCAASFGLTLLVMSPQIQALGGISAIARGNVSGELLEKTTTPFMARHTDPSIAAQVAALHRKVLASAAAGSTGNEQAVVITAFLFSELRAAFELGLVLLIPFVVLDLLVINALMALGIVSMPHAVVALPLKLLLFFAVDGWRLLLEKVVTGYL